VRRKEVLEADQIGDEEECLLRDHLLVVHPNTIEAETLGVLFKQFRRHRAAPPAA
jgi:hypothetical protein